MMDTICSLLAGVVVIFVAGFLVRKQDKFREAREGLDKDFQDILENATCDFSTLTGEEEKEYTLANLEHNVKKINERLDNIKKPAKLERRGKHANHKKNFTND